MYHIFIYLLFHCTFICSYCQAQIAAKEALSKLRNLGVPTERPEDYFAEMLKTDAHMQKVGVTACHLWYLTLSSS